MIRRHQLDGFASEQTRVAARTLAQHHLEKARIVGRRRDKAAAARFKIRLLAYGKELHLSAAFGIARKGLGEPAMVALRHMKAGVVHAERLKDAFGEKGAEALAGEDFDETAEHVDRAAVFPVRPGLMHERQAGERRRVL